MKKLSLLLGLCSANIAYAEPVALPPIINNSTYTDGSSYSGRKSVNQPMLEMLKQVESLRTEIQNLRGQVEQQEYEFGNLKKRQQNIYADINSRIQQLETGRSSSDSLSQHEGENSAIPLAQTQAVVPIQQTTSQSGMSEKTAFDHAFASVKNSHYHQAIKLFKQFLQDYPASGYTDNATFWLASVYRVVNDLPEAKKTFQAVYTRFPDSEKASSAMLKLADIYEQENNLNAAKKLYQKIIQQHANSPSAYTAQQQLQTLGQ